MKRLAPVMFRCGLMVERTVGQSCDGQPVKFRFAPILPACEGQQPGPIFERNLTVRYNQWNGLVGLNFQWQSKQPVQGSGGIVSGGHPSSQCKGIGGRMHCCRLERDEPRSKFASLGFSQQPVSYTHLTLPTIYSV